MAMLDFDKLDKRIHEKGRLSIMTLLASQKDRSFQDLKSSLGMSDGNLITHLRTLENAELIKSMTNDAETHKRKQTRYAITKQGRKRYKEYLSLLEAIIKEGSS